MEDRVAELERELRGVQEMLAFCLYEIGEPVVVTKQALKNGLPGGAEIRIDEDVENEAFIFSLAADVD